MDKDVERVLLSQLEIQKQKLQDDIAELKQQINDNNSMENNETVFIQQGPKIEYKTLFNKHVGQLDDEVVGYLNSGWMPHGPQYYADGQFYQAVLRVPQQMMMQPR
jgi:hypothetical protein